MKRETTLDALVVIQVEYAKHCTNGFRGDFSKVVD
jgi:hypothetical protein